MTSSLPNFAAASAPAGPAPVNAASLADLGAAGPAPAAGDFADFMPESDAAAECPATATAIPGFTVLAPTFFTLLARPMTADAVDLLAVPESVPAADTATATKGISRDTMEQAASLLAALVQTLLPQAAAPEAIAAGAAVAAPPASAETMPTTTARRDAGPPIAGNVLEGPRPCGPSITDQATLAAANVEGPALEGSTPAASMSSATAQDALAANISAATSAPDAGSPVPPYSFEAHLTADGAVEINATLPLPKEQGSAGKSNPGAAPGAWEIQAELQLPGQAVLRLSATDTTARELPGRANFAAKISAGKFTLHSAEAGSERNFLIAGEKEVTSDSPAAGIAVAKPATTMKSTPTEETRATGSLDTFLGLPNRGEFTVAWPSADRHSAPPTVSPEKNFAERAVATVANLVDTQFTASMQKSGSVQLRLKFGGEDLSVRVELRGGEVHTDFRTDSPELRAALHREWQAVASQSSDALRSFVEPVFSPSAGGDSSSSSRQQAAQQDLAQQQRQPRAHADNDTLTFTRRSLVGETFTPQPPAPRVAALLPTSLRLSVLA